MIKRLIARWAHFCWNGIPPFFGIGKHWIDIKDHATERKQLVANDLPYAEFSGVTGVGMFRIHLIKMPKSVSHCNFIQLPHRKRQRPWWVKPFAQGLFA